MQFLSGVDSTLIETWASMKSFQPSTPAAAAAEKPGGQAPGAARDTDRRDVSDGKQPNQVGHEIVTRRFWKDRSLAGRSYFCSRSVSPSLS